MANITESTREFRLKKHHARNCLFSEIEKKLFVAGYHKSSHIF